MTHAEEHVTPDTYTPDQIREFWTRQALDHEQSPAASWSDTRVIELEIAEILDRLAAGDRVLDVGCANGYSTVRYASNLALDIKGVDYVPEMIDYARARLKEDAIRLAGSVRFDVGDITSLDEPDASYDKLVVTRVLINLGDWETQLGALRECSRVLRTGGLLLLSEATLQGWRRLNAFRGEWNLPPIPMPPFNHYLDQDLVASAVVEELEFVEMSEFASTYFVGTRVLKPLLIQALGAKIDVADPGMEWNRWMAQLPSCGDYGTQKLFVFRKR